ncbi:unnamed protein product [Protopolystoma xenopodis]|uniref:Uncharacterized protein n=1 Tax=Protopolystoma xenopodis TaxID=117903 RepID=A0A3S5AE95_9PLAT|nr:unnamed protein product [Protopolystoma xenopodis]
MCVRFKMSAMQPTDEFECLLKVPGLTLLQTVVKWTHLTVNRCYQGQTLLLSHCLFAAWRHNVQATVTDAATTRLDLEQR